MKRVRIPANLTELAYTNIRESILSGEFKAGDRLSEDRLASGLGISKSPVREALNRLSVEGLVQIFPRVSAQVTEYDRDEIKEMFELREALEVLATKLLVPNRELISELRGIVERCERHVANKDLRKFMLEDTRFHLTLVRASGNRFLIRVYQNLQDLVELVRVRSIRLPGRPARPHQEHRQLVGTLEAGDLQLFEELLRAHIRSVCDDLTEYMNRQTQVEDVGAGEQVKEVKS